MQSGLKFVAVVCGLLTVSIICSGYFIQFYTMKSEPIELTSSDSSEVRSEKVNLARHVENSCKQHDLSEEVTVVTMYLALGTVSKGCGRNFRSPDIYYRWMATYQQIRNPVIAFFDNDTVMEYFEKIREHLGPNRTKSFLINRNETWAFGLMANISRIFKKPGYPRHHPNTVIPEYSCAMHAKYEVMLFSTRANLFCTRYFAWVDIGYFRFPPQNGTLAEIWLPPDFNTSSVAYTEIHRRCDDLDPESIVKKNAVWVVGGFLLLKLML